MHNDETACWQRGPLANNFTLNWGVLWCVVNSSFPAVSSFSVPSASETMLVQTIMQWLTSQLSGSTLMISFPGVRFNPKIPYVQFNHSFLTSTAIPCFLTSTSTPSFLTYSSIPFSDVHFNPQLPVQSQISYVQFNPMFLTSNSILDSIRPVQS